MPYYLMLPTAVELLLLCKRVRFISLFQAPIYKKTQTALSSDLLYLVSSGVDFSSFQPVRDRLLSEVQHTSARSSGAEYG